MGSNDRAWYDQEPFADVAQLVEHHLAKVRVASSNLVVRSLPGFGRCDKSPPILEAAFVFCPSAFYGHFLVTNRQKSSENSRGMWEFMTAL